MKQQKNSTWSRKGKLNLLQAIKYGRRPPESLLPPQVYIFDEISKDPVMYEHKGKQYSENEYLEFCDRVERFNAKSVVIKLVYVSPENFDQDKSQ